MPKVPISARVEDSIAKRLERVATVDRRTLANIIEICVEEYLPILEAELQKNGDLRDEASPTTPAQERPEIKYPVPGRSKLPSNKRGIAKAKEN